MDYSKYEEVDRPNAYKSRKKAGAWCKGKKGIKCVYEYRSQHDCMWQLSPYRVASEKSKRYYWKCGCYQACVKCGRHKNRWGNKTCQNTLNKSRTMPRGEDIQISSYSWG